MEETPKKKEKPKSEKLGKTLCGGSGHLTGKDLETFLEIVEKPKFYCERCHRVAKKKKFLCKPEPLCE